MELDPRSDCLLTVCGKWLKVTVVSPSLIFQFYLRQVAGTCNRSRDTTHIDFNMGMRPSSLGNVPDIRFPWSDLYFRQNAEQRTHTDMHTSDKMMVAVQDIQIVNR